MTVYLVVDTLLTDPALYEQYKLQAKPLLEKHGGEYLARGGKLTVLESDLWTPTRMVLVRFASPEQVEKFYRSDEYQALLKISKRSAKRTLFMLEGI